MDGLESALLNSLKLASEGDGVSTRYRRLFGSSGEVEWGGSIGGVWNPMLPFCVTNRCREKQGYAPYRSGPPPTYLYSDAPTSHTGQSRKHGAELPTIPTDTVFEPVEGPPKEPSPRRAWACSHIRLNNLILKPFDGGLCR